MIYKCVYTCVTPCFQLKDNINFYMTCVVQSIVLYVHVLLNGVLMDTLLFHASILYNEESQ